MIIKQKRKINFLERAKYKKKEPWDKPTANKLIFVKYKKLKLTDENKQTNKNLKFKEKINHANKLRINKSKNKKLSLEDNF